MPSPGAGEVLIRVAYNGLCGSDVHEYFTGPAATTLEPHPLTGCSIPCVLGHEFSGRIEAVGIAVHDLGIGELSDAASALDYLQSIKKLELKPVPFLKKPAAQPAAQPAHR